MQNFLRLAYIGGCGKKSIHLGLNPYSAAQRPDTASRKWNRKTYCHE